MHLTTHIRQRFSERRLGFTIEEVMTGEHEFEPGFGPAGDSAPSSRPDAPEGRNAGASRRKNAPEGRNAGASGRRFMEFRITWGPPNILEWLNPMSKHFFSQPLHGSITIDGLCQDVPCEGTLELRYFSERAIRYTLEFTVNGMKYRLIAQKTNIWPWNLHHSHTTCHGRLIEVDSGRLVSRSITYFRWRTLPAFVRSLRLA